MGPFLRGILTSGFSAKKHDSSDPDPSRQNETAASDNPIEWRDISDNPEVTIPTQGDGPSATTDADVDEVIGAGVLLDGILDGLGEAILVVDETGRITNSNRQARNLFGVDSERIEGQRVTDLHETDRSKSLVESVIERGEEVRQRETELIVGRESIPVERTAFPILDHSGETVAAIELDRDITEKVREREQTEQIAEYQKAVLDDFGNKLEQLAAGDLTINPTVPEPPADFQEINEVETQFRGFNRTLTDAVGNFRDVIGRLTKLADELTDTGQQLSATTEEVSSSIEEISASSDEMATGSDSLAEQSEQVDHVVSNLSASIEEIASTTEQIDRRSERASSLARDGAGNAGNVIGDIRDAVEASEEIVDEIGTLEKRMADIDEIIDVISDIADQTNLLALNASIEAANAGEAGKGFAVVANEIKTLAGETQDSAAEIEKIVANTQRQTTTLATAIDTANEEVNEGADAVAEIVEQVETIESAVKETSQGAGEISHAVNDQAENVEEVSSMTGDTASLGEEISASIQEIAAAVDQQAQAVDDVAYTAQELGATSDELHSRVEQFRLSSDETARLDEADH